MNITVNDKKMIVPDACTISMLCGIMNIQNSDGAAIAVGMEVLSPSEYLAHQLKDGDKVTIIRATCGG
ncbi:MAG: sulfur carrier protein ThiS [Bacteroidales bacterium]|nr:sulfur carrier protein ThiS [Bacteroidales bacterium]